MIVNANEFRRPAMYFEKHGQYPCGKKGTTDYIQWWLEEQRRCLVGYSVGGIFIPGNYYYYLNYCPIQQVVKTVGKAGKRVLTFPKFWDVDYAFFMSLHIAKYGAPEHYLIDPTTGVEFIHNEDKLKGIKKYMDSLPISIPIRQTIDNFQGAKHLLWLKPRGVGASFKGGSLASRNYHLVGRSNSYVFADNKEFLLKDGIYSKFLEYMDWINVNAPEFSSYQAFKRDRNNMHFINSDDDGAGNAIGLQSQVIGVPIANNANKARGKRGQLYLMEESGSFGSLDTSWIIIRRSVEEFGIGFGTIVGFGTGGQEGSDFESMQQMFYNVDTYGILAFDNIYDIGLQGTDCAMFTPAYYNVQCIDKNGNTDTERGRRELEKEYKAAHKSKNATDIIKVKAELPTCPADAMLNTNINNFVSQELVNHRNYVFTKSLHTTHGVAVTLERNSDGKIISRYNDDKNPKYHPAIHHFPHKGNMDLYGSVVEYSKPYHKNGKIPDHLYIIGHDPYADDYAQDKTSLGATYVYMNVNNIVPGDIGDRIVASWIGRPETTDEYNDILFMLSERWNALIGFENDRGDVLGYAKRYKKQHQLAPEFELAFDENIMNKKAGSRIKYGMRMGGGKNNVKILTGNRYIRDNIYQDRGEDLSGQKRMNMHLIKDVALLDELRFYNEKGNFDRISALRIVHYYARELAYNQVQIKEKDNSNDAFIDFITHERFV